MRRQIVVWWFDWQQSLWFLPTLITLGTTLLALLLVRLDQSLALAPGGHYTWAFGGGASGARGVLQAIAGSIITVTGTVFSITIVALQLASSQFSPRVLRTFTSDRGVQVVLGIFVGTFTYCLLVLRSVRSELEDGSAFVPSVSVTVAVGLALLSIGCLIYYIHHVARSIQIANVALRVTVDTRQLIERTYDTFPDAASNEILLDSPKATAYDADETVSISADSSGYLRDIDPAPLFEHDDEMPVLIQLRPRIGDFVLQGSIIAQVAPPAAVTNERIAAIRSALSLGDERTMANDVDFGIRQLVDIAVKALSPGINDPTSATDCIDRLGELVGQLVRRASPQPIRRHPDNPVTVELTQRSIAELIDTAFLQIRFFGAGDVIVMTHLLTMLGTLATLATPANKPAILDHARNVLEAVERETYLPSERSRIAAAASWLS